MHSSPTKKIILVPRWSKCTFSHPLKDEKDVSDLPLEVKCTCIVCLDTSKYGKNNCTTVIDQQPSWARTTPPDYVEKRLQHKKQQIWKTQAVSAIQCRFGVVASCDNSDDLQVLLPRPFRGRSASDVTAATLSAARNQRWRVPIGRIN